jgi:hypothetical protein
MVYDPLYSHAESLVARLAMEIKDHDVDFSGLQRNVLELAELVKELILRCQ